MASIYRRKRGGTYYVTYKVRPGQRKTVKGCRDKAATEALARKLEADALLRATGVIDARAEQLAHWEATPFREHLDAFEEAMQAKGTTAKHIQATLNYVRGILAACGFEKPSDLDGPRVSAHVADLKRRGVGTRTINARLTALKSFSRWLFRNERVRTDPMMQVAKLNGRTDRRRQRRALSEEEIIRLLDAAERGPTVMGVAGKARALIYRLALGTGLRASELASLTPASFDVDDPRRATVTVRAAYSKHRRDDVLPMRRDLAVAVADFIEGKPAGEPVLAVPEKTAKMLREDLLAAGLAREVVDQEGRTRIDASDASGRVLDFHALRHTFITRLARSGVAPAVAKSLARHSTITLTMDHYTHTLIEDERSALDRLPALAPGHEVTQATGTDDLGQPAGASESRQERPPARSASAARHCPGTPRRAAIRQQKGPLTSNGEGAQTVANATTYAHSPSYVAGGPPGTRTPDPLIKSQLLCQLS